MSENNIRLRERYGRVYIEFIREETPVYWIDGPMIAELASGNTYEVALPLSAGIENLELQADSIERTAQRCADIVRDVLYSDYESTVHAWEDTSTLAGFTEALTGLIADRIQKEFSLNHRSLDKG